MKSFETFKRRQRYVDPSRLPYFKLAAAYVPDDPNAVVVDIGAGDGAFIEQTGLADRSVKLHLLDGNQQTVERLRQKFPQAQVEQYQLPQHSSFQSETVSFVHLSHLIEHLRPDELYRSLIEIDRILKPGGRLVISTPLRWDRFWDDLSHVRPYNPEVLRKYLITDNQNATREVISTQYEELDLVYRHRSAPVIEVTSKYFVMYILLKGLNYLLLKLGFRRYYQNGYTIVLEKKS